MVSLSVIRKYLFLVFILTISNSLFCQFLSDLSDKERFVISLLDAEKAGVWEMSDSLIAVAPWNNYIIWDKPEMENRKKVLVVSYIELKHFSYFLNEAAAKSLKAAINTAKVGKDGISTDVNGVRIILNEKDADEFLYFFDKESSGWYNKNFPQKYDQLRGRDVSWVTIVPEIGYYLNKFKESKEFETLLNGKPNLGEMDPVSNALRYRLNQKLGLWPDEMSLQWSNKKGNLWPKFLVVMWVNPADLFRPALNAEIFDVQAIPDDSNGVPAPYVEKELAQVDVFSNRNLGDDVKRSSELQTAAVSWDKDLAANRYRAWFAATKRGQYSRTKMPWTRLGYTYDWAPESFLKDKFKGHYGFSEFCVKPLAESKMVAIYSLDKYAGNDVKRDYAATISKQFESCVNVILQEMTQDSAGDITTVEQDKIKKVISKKINAYSALLNLLKQDRKKRGDIKEENSLEKYLTEIQKAENDIKILIRRLNIEEFLEIKKPTKGGSEEEQKEYMRTRTEQGEPEI